MDIGLPLLYMLLASVGSLPQPADNGLPASLLTSLLLVAGSLLPAEEEFWLPASVVSAPSLEVGAGSLNAPEDVSASLVGDVVVAGGGGVTGGVTFEVGAVVFEVGVVELLEDD